MRGFAPLGDWRTWYRVTGESRDGRPAVVILHGGPGSTHDYLLNMVGLAEWGFPVVHYDQLGNGGSTHLPDKEGSFWTVELFLAELDNLLGHLGIGDNYVLFGHSWGGMLAARHAGDQPTGLRGVVIANAPASYPLWLEAMAELRAELPAGVDAILRRHEAGGTTDSDEYRAAVHVFMEKHVCRVKPWPRDYLATHYEVVSDPTVYFTMNGPSEFHVVGTLRDWSVIEYCSKITVPALLISGKYDEATPSTVQPYQDLICDVRWEIFEESSHTPHVEEPERFTKVLLNFLESLPRKSIAK
jgi:L-proline amide hydrolase